MSATTCASCGRANRAGARFCGGCGRPMVPRCPACGAESDPGAQFCDACGASLGAPAAPAAEDDVARKIVTIVFADLIGSTALHERLDAESARRVMDRYHRTMADAVAAHGGTVMQLLGDGVLAGFGVPRVAEDDAIRAVRAAVGMQTAFRELAREQARLAGDLGLRVAVHSGEVVTSDDNTHVMGDPVNVAARLQQEARDGDVLIGESTRRLVGELVTLAPVGTFALKGRVETVAAYRVVSLDRPGVATAIAFVGRDDELRRLTAVYDAAVGGPGARLAVVLGSPGLGKSRLVTEFVGRLGSGATVLTARCDATAGATFAPMAEALRAFIGVDDGSDGLRAAIDAAMPGDEVERARIGAGLSALLAGTPAPPEETFFVVRRFLAGLSAARAVVLVIDDLHWAEPLLLDLTEHLVQWSTGVPLLVLAAARPELRDVRSSLTITGGVAHDVVTLGGLDAGAATRLAANVIGADALPAAIAGRVLATSEGNPLFVGELVRMLVDDGTLRREGDRWVAGVDLAGIEMPPTIHALLAARIERLRPDERSVLERAAVIGRQFSRAALVELLPPELRGDVDARLEALRRSELVEPDAGWFLGDPGLRFHHMLIRDAAYRRLLKNTRAELHGRLADWLERRVDGAVEHDETIGWHLEQAHQHLQELGPIDAAGRALGERAARHLAAAGRRALARDDLPLAASLLGRALERLDGADPARADLALDWCEALLAAGDVGPAARALDELARFTAASPRLRAWHTCFAGQRAALVEPQALRATVDAVAAAAADLAAEGDAAGEAKAHAVHANALARLGRIGDSEAALDRALAAARRAGDRRRASAVLAGAPQAALWGPSPVTRASGRCLDVVRVLRITQGAPAVEATALRCQAVLEALRGRTEAARRMIAVSRGLVQELGITQRLLEVEVSAGLIELLERDAATAESHLREAYDGLRRHGLAIDAAQAGALLGRALLALDRPAEAEALSHESEALAGDDLKAAIAWRGVRAEALARRGEHAAAVDFARAAVDIASATDALLDHADARLALAMALRAAGRTSDAEAEEARAGDLWEAKGATLLVARVRRAPAGGALEHPLAERAAAGRRVRPNAATGNAARMDAAATARDVDAWFATLGPGSRTLHHPTATEYEDRASLDDARVLLSDENLIFAHEPLATLGESLALCRVHLSTGAPAAFGGTMGPADFGNLAVLEVDAQGRRVRTEFFALDRQADAVARLYERYADLLSDETARARAARTARAIAVWMRPVEVGSIRSIIAPGVEFRDHRTLGIGASRGAETFLEAVRILVEATHETTTRVDEVLALAPDVLLVRWTHAGLERRGGGAFERRLLMLWSFGSDGLLTHMEEFDLDDEAAALRRFDELRASGTSAGIDTTALRTQALFQRLWDARDWDGIVAGCAPGIELDDRRALIGLKVRGEEFLTHLRLMFGMPAGRWASEQLATRGDRLALFRERLRGEVGDGGHVAFDNLTVLEVDAEGRSLAVVIFDPQDVAPAFDEIHTRFLRGEGAPYGATIQWLERLQRAIAARAWQEAATAFTDDFVAEDHRIMGWETLRSGADYLGRVRALLELRPDTALRLTHILALDDRRQLIVACWTGSGEGSFEIPLIVAVQLAADGRIHHWDLFDLDQLDAARACYEALAEGPPTFRLENAATRAGDRVFHAMGSGDWSRVTALFPSGFRSIDREWRLETDRDTYLEAARPMIEVMSSTPTAEILATRGDRLALSRLRWSGGGGQGAGPVELEWLAILEVDDKGEVQSSIEFGRGDLEAAYAELDARFAADEAAATRRAAVTRAFNRVFADRDWEAFDELLAPDLTVHDHRTLGWETLHGPAAYVQALRSLVDLAPDVQLRTDHIRMAPPRFLYVTSWVGTHEGGAFEAPSVIVSEIDDEGRIRRFDQYDLSQMDEAHARLAVGAETIVKDPLAALIRRNAGTAAADRMQAAFDARDWAALRAACAPGATIEDRRRQALVSGDAEWWIADMRELVRATPDIRFERRPQGTYGARIALDRVLWIAEHVGGRVEVEYLRLVEADADGRIAAVIGFDLDDWRAAGREVMRRNMATDARATVVLGAVLELSEGVNDHDLARLRAVCADDLVFHDRRRTGMGRIDGAEAYLDAVQVLWNLAPDVQVQGLGGLALEPHGLVGVARFFGTLADGGAFESLMISMSIVEQGRITRIEAFEIDDVDAALARFAELRPDPLRIPPNAATRAEHRRHDARQARDWDTLEALYAPTLVFDDRRRAFLTTGDRELLITSTRYIGSRGTRAAATVLATAGDRLALTHVRWTGPDGGPAFEIETLEVLEVDTEGRVVAVIVFDVDDRRAASLELFERFVRHDPHHAHRTRGVELVRALRDHDLARARAALPDDYFFHDHRCTGAGRIEGADAYIDWVRALFDLSPDAVIETLYHIAAVPNADLAVGRTFGTSKAGGVFESFFVRLMLFGGDQFIGSELFEVEDLEVARARFEALREPG